MTETMDPKKRILEVAARLFAQRGFNAVGIREIARQAGVNVAMISYYFGSKVGVLEAIIEMFFDQYEAFLDTVDMRSDSPEKCLRVLIRRIVVFMERWPEVGVVTYNELPLDVPEIAELKARRSMRLFRRISVLFERFGLDPQDRSLMSIIGPAVISVIFGNFRNRPVLRQVFALEFDERYNERFAETLATLFLDGIHGVARQISTSEGGGS